MQNVRCRNGLVSFPQSLSNSVTFFSSLNTIKKTFRVQLFNRSEKKINKFTVIYIILSSVDFN